jgi:hypothetical protein
MSQVITGGSSQTEFSGHHKKELADLHARFLEVDDLRYMPPGMNRSRAKPTKWTTGRLP